MHSYSFYTEVYFNNGGKHTVTSGFGCYSHLVPSASESIICRAHHFKITLVPDPYYTLLVVISHLMMEWPGFMVLQNILLGLCGFSLIKFPL